MVHLLFLMMGFCGSTYWQYFEALHFVFFKEIIAACDKFLSPLLLCLLAGLDFEFFEDLHFVFFKEISVASIFVCGRVWMCFQLFHHPDEAAPEQAGVLIAN